MLSAAAALFALAPLSAFGQAPAAKVATPTAQSKSAHRTADGHPDLSGVWSTASVTPLERPKDLGSKEFFTKEEAEAYEKKSLAAAKEVVAPGTYGDVHYNMAQFGLEKGQSKVASSIRTSLIVGPTGRIPAMLPAAVERNAARAAAAKGHEFDGPETRSLGEQCIMWPNEGPPMLPAGYNSNLQIVQGQGYVAIMQEMIHDVRIIPTDGSPHLASNVRQWFGDSRGHWEGDTLVVDTTNFNGKTWLNEVGEVVSHAEHVIERFTPASPDTVNYEATVIDPVVYTRPWTISLSFKRQNFELLESACHEEDHDLPHLKALKDAAAGKK